jgi:hypothetical protein
MQSQPDPLSAGKPHPDPVPGQAYQHTEILILPEGKVLVHNLTPVMAAILERLNPSAEEIHDRVATAGDRRGTA